MRYTLSAMAAPKLQRVECQLCPKLCVIPPGGRGDCRIRVNLDGRLVAVTHGFACSVHVDPIEKKPFFHFLPGSPILSIATAGCNLHCKNCQNWEISQRDPEEVEASALPPEQVVALARQSQCPSISYTYTEPVVYFEYALDTSRKARTAGLRNTLVTAGYVNREPWLELCQVTDAARIDLKFMSDRLYQEVCDARLAPVLDTLVRTKEAGVWLEVIHLVIPTLNDRDADLTAVARWVKQNLGADTPLHFSAFYPQYRMRHLPPPPPETMVRARQIGRAEGLHFAYAGNVSIEDGEDTFCPSCGKRVVRRSRFTVLEYHLNRRACAFCGTELAGVWL